VMASRFFTASKPKDRANLFASSCNIKCKCYRIQGFIMFNRSYKEVNYRETNCYTFIEERQLTTSVSSAPTSWNAGKLLFVLC
jgi:hypothetical protein